jgi:excisionase family DNA binding protein
MAARTLTPLMTVGQVAELLNLKPSTVYDAAARGRIPSVRLWEGRRRAVVRFIREDIEAFVESKRMRLRTRSSH